MRKQNPSISIMDKWRKRDKTFLLQNLIQNTALYMKIASSKDEDDGHSFELWLVNLPWSGQHQQFLIEEELVSTNANLTKEQLI